MYQKVIRFWPVIVICLLAFILRVIKLEELFYFTYDEEIPAFVARRLIETHHIPLIGGVTPFGFHLGPYFYWLYALILALGNLNPIAWGWAAALISVITTLLMYVAGRQLSSKRVGITAAILWATFYLANVYDRHLWALYWGPLTSLVTIICLQKIIKRNYNWSVLLALTLALSIHADPSNLIFIGLTVLTFVYFKIPNPFKKILLISLFLLISILPLIVFDLRHNAANIRPVGEFLKKGENTPTLSTDKFRQNSLLFGRTATRLVYTYGDNEISKQYSYCKNIIAEKYQKIPRYLVLFSLLAIAAFIFWAMFLTSRTMPKLIAILISLYYVGIQLYGTILRGDIFEHYLTGIFPSLLLIFALLISALPKKLWLTAVAIFVTLNLIKLYQTQNSQGLTAKRQAIEWTMQQVGDKPFSLESLSTCWYYNGYRYLFGVFGTEPIKSYVDPNLGYLYEDTPIWSEHPEIVVTFVIHDFASETDAFYNRYAKLKSHEIKSNLFGNIETIILDNKSAWFDR